MTEVLTIDGSFSGTELKRLTSIDGDLRKRLESNTRQILEHAQKRVRRHGITAAELQSGSGDPAQAIIGAIRGKSNILVVGRRGRSHLSGVLLGSVSQKLTTLAPCSVMVVPSPKNLSRYAGAKPWKVRHFGNGWSSKDAASTAVPVAIM